MKTVKIIINSKTDSFGTKTVIFLAKEGGCFIVSRDEGSHSEIEAKKEVCDAQEWDNADCTL